MKESSIINALNLYCFDKIWNESVSELRNNVVPLQLLDRSTKGTITIGTTTVPLPTIDPYYIFALSKTHAHALFTKPITNEWITTETLVNDLDILLHTYTLSGKMMPKGAVYIKRYSREYYLLIINKTLTSKILSFEELKDVRVTYYLDSDFLNKINAKTFNIAGMDTSFVERNKVMDYLITCSSKNEHILTYVDGYSVTISGIGDIPTNSVVDIIHDENIVISFELDITISENNYSFFSEMDKTYKQLIHIPKALNPNNKIFTHNTMDIHIHEKDMTTGKIGRGVYLHRCAERGVTNVTHNDIAIPMFIVDAFRDHLGTQDIIFKIVIREHDKDNVLIRDKSYIDLLYTQDDATIIECLRGRVRPDLDFWQADQLEQTVYVHMMFNVPDLITPGNVGYYIEGLGYYHVLSILYRKVAYSKISDNFTGSLTFTKPYIYNNVDMVPILYLNGVKIHHSLVKYQNNNANGTLAINIDDSVVTKVGDELICEFFLSGPIETYRIDNVQSDNYYIEVPFENFDIYEVNTLLDYQKPLSDEVDYDESYSLVDDYLGKISISTGSIEGFTRITFNSFMYGNSYVVQNRHRVYYKNYDKKVLDELVESGKPFQFNLNDRYSDVQRNYPIFYKPSLEVFLNRKYLQEEVDYTVIPRKDYNGNICGDEIVFQSLEYLMVEGNDIEIYVTSAEVDNQIGGFVIDNKAYEDGELALLFEGLSDMHIYGDIYNDAVYRGNYIQTEGIPEGRLFSIRTSIPAVLKEYLEAYHPNTDLERLEILNDYFYGKAPLPPDKIVLKNSHKIFSNYLVNVSYKLLNDARYAEVTLDPDPAMMIEQLPNLKYLLENDLVLKNEDNLAFVDVMAHYRNIDVPDPDIYRILTAINAYVLPTDKYDIE